MILRTSVTWLRSGKRPPCTESNSAHSSEQRPGGAGENVRTSVMLLLHGFAVHTVYQSV